MTLQGVLEAAGTELGARDGVMAANTNGDIGRAHVVADSLVDNNVASSSAVEEEPVFIGWERSVGNMVKA